MSAARSNKQELIEEFLRKSLLGGELINTQFYLFSARSVPSSRLTKPRVLCANNILLAKSSKYFADLSSADISPSDPSLSDLTGDNDVPRNVHIDEYGYGSDSDLDDDDDDDDDGEPPIPIGGAHSAPKDQSATIPTSPPKISVTIQSEDDDDLSDDGSESVSSDMFVMSPEHPGTEEPVLINLSGARSVTSSETAIQDYQGTEATMDNVSARLRSLGSRHVLVKDTAFQTWYTLLNYLYTGKFNFLPLSSTAPRKQLRKFSTSTPDEPRCSAKSMYRLACKVGLDHLRDEALDHIRNNLTEQNILKEITCSLTSTHLELLEMELDVLYAHVASPPVVTGFPALAQCIANNELPHGASIIIGIHTRLLRGCHPSLLIPLPVTPPPPSPPLIASCTPLQPSVNLRMSPIPVTRVLDDIAGAEPYPADERKDEYVLFSQQPPESSTLVLDAEISVPQDHKEQTDDPDSESVVRKKRPQAGGGGKKKKKR